MNPSGWHRPHMDNTDTLYLWDQHFIVRNSVDPGFCFSICAYLSIPNKS